MMICSDGHLPPVAPRVEREAPGLIAVDWGTSSFRAALMSAGGEVLSSVSTSDGIATVPASDFHGVFARALAGWKSEIRELPIYLCGMVGSRQGWVETGYADCPAGFDAIARAVVRREVEGMAMRFIPGLHSHELPHGHDVMRGEETQVIGVMGFDREELVVTPGTHSKWILCRNQAVTQFRTFMTGDLYAAMKSHTILARSIGVGQSPSTDSPAFTQGVKAGYSSVSLLADAFAVRARSLYEGEDFDAVSYLSGLLIGEELGAGVTCFPAARRTGVKFVGSPALTACYAYAAACLDIQAEVADPNASFMGCHQVARFNGEV
ncbi:2-dehydro-3-deoxygalactonokinase [Cupriavidus sp. MP-37]|uniref:2-dehydro-3-deoxygalactonokinase n=1 Tax=Cupriavidus sp. MP-37 TaxID=2884455 RepID=UPI001D09F59F|nr:2-dehydro-3-deoxygalactonokinase [Cupriavidus sp. MP-37]UDM52722.1 2-dehydro-3-deoxygalactonokinase [Cupriavidus sp. MP-37]